MSAVATGQEVSEWAMDDADNEQTLIRRHRAGDKNAAVQLLERHRQRLKRFVQLRMDQRLVSRLDASDIVQEASIEALKRLDSFSADSRCGFFLWLRTLTGQKLIDAHRHRLGTQKRGGAHEVSIFRAPFPEAGSVVLANQLLGRLTSPTQSAKRAEMQLKVQEALNSLQPVDREVLVLRHFEHLSNDETAEALSLQKKTASKRYLAALRRLGECLASIPDFLNSDDC
jgi:RNA polymerase sigma-70 factor (ECF subfamily)